MTFTASSGSSSYFVPAPFAVFVKDFFTRVGEQGVRRVDGVIDVLERHDFDFLSRYASTRRADIRGLFISDSVVTGGIFTR